MDHELARRRAALVGERRVRDRPALRLGADEVLAWYEHVLEEHLVELLAAGHLAQRTYGDARGLHVADEVADALRLRRRRVRSCEQDAPARELGVARPHLLPVDDPPAVARFRARAERRQIRAGIRL